MIKELFNSKKTLKKIVFGIIIVFVGIQFIPTTRNLSNEIPSTDFNRVFNTPDNIRNQLKISCYDCHSNNTNYPWYNKIQPISFMLEDHISDGKADLNFSEFATYSKRKQKSKLKSIVSQIRDDEMPPLSYTLIHWDARLSDSDKLELKNWLNELRDSLEN